MGYLLKQSSTAKPLTFFMTDSSDHISGKTGLSPTVKIGKNGGAGAAPSGAVSEIDSTNLPGWYKVAGNATDSNTLGPLQLHATAFGADPCDKEFCVVAFDPDDAAALGLSRVDVAVSTRLAPTTPGRTLGVSAGGQVGPDWANVGNPTTSVNLSGTTVGTATTLTTNNDKTGYRLSATGVDDVWDEVQSGHTTAGTFGKYLDAAVSGVSTGGVSAADIADAVWDELTSGHVTASTFGLLMQTIAGYIDTEVAAIKAKTDNLPASPAGVSDIPSANTIADAMLDRSGAIETSITPRQALRLILAVAAGKVSGAATSNITFRNVGDTKDRLNATVDANGNRTAVTTDAT